MHAVGRCVAVIAQQSMLAASMVLRSCVALVIYIEIPPTRFVGARRKASPARGRGAGRTHGAPWTGGEERQKAHHGRPLAGDEEKEGSRRLVVVPRANE